MPRDKLRYIVIHHPASDNIKLSLWDHKKPGAPWPPYDFWVEYEPEGRIVKGRPLSVRGAHVIPDYAGFKDVNNKTAIGVAFEGNFDDAKPPFGPSDVQLEVGAALVGQLCAEWDINPRRVLPHRAVSQTACPGRHFMAVWDKFIGKVRWYYTQSLTEDD